jgi:hypothetical protein
MAVQIIANDEQNIRTIGGGDWIGDRCGRDQQQREIDSSHLLSFSFQ